MGMRGWWRVGVLVLCVLALVACGSSSSGGDGAGAGGAAGAAGSAGAGGEAGSGGTSDGGAEAAQDAGGDASWCSQPGALACNEVIGAWCARMAQCCSVPDANCPSWGLTTTECQAHEVAIGRNCANAAFATVTVCADKTTACMNDAPIVACTDITNGTANWPATCVAFWSQYQ